MIGIKDRIPVCPHGSGTDIDVNLIYALEKIERDTKLELEFSSGYRCRACNTSAGGAKNSAHLRGRAVDILADNSRERWEIVSAALKVGFRRVGVAKGFVHLDVDPDLMQEALWLY